MELNKKELEYYKYNSTTSKDEEYIYTVRVKLQYEDLKGNLYYVSSNKDSGIDVLDFSFNEYYLSEIIDDDCNFECNSELICELELKNDHDCMRIIDRLENLNIFIVGIEIIDCKKIKKNK